MEFCVISPTSTLEHYATQSKRHLVLSFLYLNEDTTYKKFYHERREAGDFIILDNGSYEGCEPYLSVAALSNLKPQVAVLPDYFLQPWQKTWHAAIHWLDVNAELYPDTQWCYIPQALPGDLDGFLQSYHEATADSRITWIGIPRALAYAITDNPLARVEFARMVRKDHPALHLHAFGMVNGDIHELGYLAQAGVESIDSSAPVWRGWNGYRITDRSWDGRPVDFSARFTSGDGDTPDYRQENLDMILEACNVKSNPGR